MKMIDKIRELKNEAVTTQDFETAMDFRSIERWLEFNHDIEEIFDNKNNYYEKVKNELKKLERLKKLYKITKNN